MLYIATSFSSFPRRGLVALLLASACQQAPAAQPEPEYVVTLVAGGATAGKRALRLLDPLPGGTRIHLAQGARLIVFRFRDAMETTMTGSGQFVVGREGIAPIGGSGTLRQERMDQAYGTAAMRNPVPAGVTVRAGGLQPAATPHTGETVAPGTLVLRWSERAHSGNYGVVLADAADRTLHVAEVAEQEVVIPAGLLAPGGQYRWELSWRDGAGVMRLAEHRFSVLSAADAATLERLRPAAGASSSRRVLFGLWLRAKGASTLAAPFLEL